MMNVDGVRGWGDKSQCAGSLAIGAVTMRRGEVERTLAKQRNYLRAVHEGVGPSVLATQLSAWAYVRGRRSCSREERQLVVGMRPIHGSTTPTAPARTQQRRWPGQKSHGACERAPSHRPSTQLPNRTPLPRSGNLDRQSIKSRYPPRSSSLPPSWLDVPQPLSPRHSEQAQHQQELCCRYLLPQAEHNNPRDPTPVPSSA
ncbi:uncharacterized protein B0T15DRAFT_68186 [Chaetomium strumarium]|uniref:Uncharacterized protein n=1 Tax=Chaetomium strumarium TaxID=1170767 RepID=A0AAJ0M740_9PEZI|nr:hypothetical protein B0T15DRAFT_68186 [Chaetomium strumarium]